MLSSSGHLLEVPSSPRTPRPVCIENAENVPVNQLPAAQDTLASTLSENKCIGLRRTTSNYEVKESAMCDVESRPGALLAAEGQHPAVARVRRSFSVRSIQRCWRGFSLSNRTTAALAAAVEAASLTGTGVQALSFYELATFLQSPEALEPAAAFLSRVELLLHVAGQEQLASIRAVLEKYSPSEPSPPGGSPPARPERFPTRLFLSAFMIATHPREVLSSPPGCAEGQLRAAAGQLLAAFDRAVAACGADRGPGGGRLTAARELDAQWDVFVSKFGEWKSEDAEDLEGDLIFTALQLETRVAYKCGLRTYDELGEEERAEVAAVEADLHALRQRIGRDLAGAAGVERMDRQLAQLREDVRQELLEAQLESAVDEACRRADAAQERCWQEMGEAAAPPPRRRGAPAQLETEAGGPVEECPSGVPLDYPPEDEPADPDAESGHFLGLILPRLDVRVVEADGTELTNEQIVYELLHDERWRPVLRGAGDADEYDSHALALELAALPEDVAEGPPGGEEGWWGAAEGGCWGAVAGHLRQSPPCLHLAGGVVKEVLTRACLALPRAMHAHAQGLLMVSNLFQIMMPSPEEGLARLDELHCQLAELLDWCRPETLTAAARRAHASVRASVEASAGPAPSRRHVADAVVRWLHVVDWDLQRIVRAAAEAHVAELAPLVTQSPAGLHCAASHFAQRHRLLAEEEEGPVSPRKRGAASTPPPSPPRFVYSSGGKVEKEAYFGGAGAAGSSGRPPVSPRVRELQQRLPRAAEFLEGAAGELAEAERLLEEAGSYPGVEAAAPSASDFVPRKLRAGHVGSEAAAEAWAAEVAAAEVQEAAREEWGPVSTAASWQGLLCIGLARLVAARDPPGDVAEPLELDSGRLRACRHAFQRATVGAACLLVHAQARALRGPSSGPWLPADELRRHVAVLTEDPSISLGDLAAEVARCAGVAESGGLGAVESLLGRAVERSGAVFGLVERGVGRAVLLAVLRGTQGGREPARAALAKCGGAALLEDVEALAAHLREVAKVSAQVHGLWYRDLSEPLLRAYASSVPKSLPE